MLQHISSLLNSLPHPFLRVIKRLHQQYSIHQWMENGQPVPPPHLVKVHAIKKYCKHFDSKIFVETGTYMGDMLDEVKNEFTQLHSIELSPKYFLRAKAIFNTNSKIQLHYGDSGKVLRKLLPKLQAPTLLWLDAHYSGGTTARGTLDTPIVQELDTISRHKLKNQFVIMIDDARLFIGKNSYPKLSLLRKYIEKRFPQHKFSVENDAIIIAPLHEK